MVLHVRNQPSLARFRPCLEGPVPIDAWSDFLVGFAVVEYAMGREWEHALDTVLRVKPTVSRSYGPVEVRNYASGVEFEPAEARALPTDATFYLDGVQITREPDLGKIHIVQRELAGVWTTFVLLGETFPDEWRAPEEVVPEEVQRARVRASVFAMGGFATGGQSLSAGSADELIPELTAGNGLVAIGSFGDYHPMGPVGGFWDLSGPMELGNGVGIEAYVGPAVDLGPVTLNAGAGMTSVRVTDVNSTRTAILPQPHLGARYILGLSDSLDLDASLGGGWAPSGWHGKLHAGVRGGGMIGWNAGLDASANNGYFVEATGDRRASVSAIRLGLRAGVAFGR